MQEPKTLEELHNWVVKQLEEQRPDMDDKETNLVAEVICATVNDPEYIPAFLDGFQEGFMSSWPMKKKEAKA